MVAKYTYTGPSWAASSFPTESTDATNLAHEWRIPYHNTSAHGASNRSCFEKVKNSKLPIIWIYCEPLIDLEIPTNEILIADNWKDIREECNQNAFRLMESLDVPVLLFGAHSDIVNCSAKNVTIGHHSWQKFLAQEAGLTISNGTINVTPSDGGNYNLENCWGAETVHRAIHEKQNVQPTQSLLDSVWDIYFFWEYLESKNLFFEVHPNSNATRLFADHTRTTVENFLNVHSIT